MADAPKPQADKFRDLTRELERDEDEGVFEEKMGKVATASIDDPDNPEWTAEDFRRARHASADGTAAFEDDVQKVATAATQAPEK